MRYILIMILNLLGFLTAPIVFPIAYFLRDVSIVRNKLLWIYYDDEDDFGFDVEWFMVGRKRNFFTAYKWCALRNPAWNLQASSRLDESKLYVFTKTKGILQHNGIIVSPSLKATAVLKYVNKEGFYMDNKGDFLSEKFSVLGSQYAEFYEVSSGRRYWRYSVAKNILNDFWLELQVGYHTRPTFRLKIKKVKLRNETD